MNILRKIIFLMCTISLTFSAYAPMRLTELEMTRLEAQDCERFNKKRGLHSEKLTLAQAQQLHKDGFDVNELRQADSVFLEQKTPLHVACCNRTEDGPLIVQFLVEQGAKVNARSSLGTTPLFESLSSTYENCFKNVSFLVEHGAQVNVLCRIGDTIQTPLGNLQEDVIWCQKQRDTEKTLIAKGAVSKSFGPDALSFSNNEELTDFLANDSDDWVDDLETTLCNSSYKIDQTAFAKFMIGKVIKQRRTQAYLREILKALSS